MRTIPALRPRLTDKGEPVPVGGSPLFRFHQGDVFYPGAGNFALDYYQTLPVLTVWGQATLGPNPLNPIQPQQVFIGPGAQIRGLTGGPVAGTFVDAPLWDEGS